MELNVENAKKVLEDYLKESNPKKYEHSLAVAEIAEKLARKWRVNAQEAVIAALLHDIGKSMKREEMVEFCEQNGIAINEFERSDNQEALHGKISAYLFKMEFKEGENGKRTNKRTRRKIAHAIESHVSGNKEMCLLDKIIFLADDIESKKGGQKLLQKILAERGRRPGRYIGRIVDRKLQKAIEKNRMPNPVLIDTIPRGKEGDSRRNRFHEAIKVIAKNQRNEVQEPQSGNSIKDVIYVMPPQTVVSERS